MPVICSSWAMIYLWTLFCSLLSSNCTFKYVHDGIPIRFRMITVCCYVLEWWFIRCCFRSLGVFCIALFYTELSSMDNHNKRTHRVKYTIIHCISLSDFGSFFQVCKLPVYSSCLTNNGIILQIGLRVEGSGRL